MEAEQNSSSSSTFISEYDFERAGDDKTRRKINPLQSWAEFTKSGGRGIDRIHRVNALKEMTVTIKDHGQISYYAELEDAKHNIANVWVTEIIYKSLQKHDLSSGSVYIRPLGKAKAKESGHEYHDFVIVTV